MILLGSVFEGVNCALYDVYKTLWKNPNELFGQSNTYLCVPVSSQPCYQLLHKQLLYNKARLEKDYKIVQGGGWLYS